ncbi:TPA: glycosyltransferase family 92 protein [Candidatus Scatousia excrementigallinarum]|uniref:Glycosyltransferase family 92 protein n=1 Tax=Candidatus Scatousia excrementigallinarum TaxID=2840935 RepID=A0A9D1EYF1_9BACT|nr:glycosyltransferase family 92 protein [Candidatus Scatousia excrementigallinarum]
MENSNNIQINNSVTLNSVNKQTGGGIFNILSPDWQSWCQKLKLSKTSIRFINFISPVLNFIFGGVACLYGKIKGNQMRRTYDYNLAVVAIAKNESEYIREWVVFHKIIGVSIIYLYDNNSADNMRDKISDFIESGFVVYEVIHGERRQCDAYNDALHKYGAKCKYMAFFDCDEFLMPKIKGVNITQLLDKYFKANGNIGGVGFNWCLFGSSGYIDKPDGLVSENYVWRAADDEKTDRGSDGKRINYEKEGNDIVKSIISPRLVKYFASPHFPIYRYGYYSVNQDLIPFKGAYSNIKKFGLIRFNHYFTKSKNEWIKRRAIGKADMGSNDKRNLEGFYKNDYHDIYDISMLEYKDEIIKLI